MHLIRLPVAFRGGFVGLSAIAMLSCSGGGTDYNGVLMGHEQGLVFRQCGSEVQWWLVMDSTLRTEMTTWIEGKAAAAPPDTVSGQVLLPSIFATLRGDLDSAGRYGPDSAFTRELHVSGASGFRKMRRDECL